MPRSQEQILTETTYDVTIGNFAAVLWGGEVRQAEGAFEVVVGFRFASASSIDLWRRRVGVPDDDTFVNITPGRI